MNGSFLLLDDIKNNLSDAFRNFPFAVSAPEDALRPGRENRIREPKVYLGQLPPRIGDKPLDFGRKPHGPAGHTDDPEYTPFIVVKLLDYQVGGEAMEGITANIGIVFTAYVPEDDREAGLHDLLNMGDRIVLTLRARDFWVDGHWKRQTPVSLIQGTGKAENIYESGLQDRGPYFGGAVTASFSANGLAPLGPYGIVDSE